MSYKSTIWSLRPGLTVCCETARVSSPCPSSRLSTHVKNIMDNILLHHHSAHNVCIVSSQTRHFSHCLHTVIMSSQMLSHHNSILPLAFFELPLSFPWFCRGASGQITTQQPSYLRLFSSMSPTTAWKNYSITSRKTRGHFDISVLCPDNPLPKMVIGS